MVWSRSMLAAALVVMSASVATAQGAPDDPDRDILIELERGWHDAFYRRDADFIETLLADEFVATYDDGSQGDKQTELALAAAFNQRVVSAEQERFTVRLYGETAVVGFLLRVVGIRQGEEVELRLQYTDVWVKRDGRWQCVSTHSTRVTDG